MIRYWPAFFGGWSDVSADKNMLPCCTDTQCK